MMHNGSEQVQHLLKDIVDSGVLLFERCGEQLAAAYNISIDRGRQRTAREFINWRIHAAVHRDWRTKHRATAESIWIGGRQQAGAAP